jgi:dinuclear metal center YbgI/SA1388 family protein
MSSFMTPLSTVLCALEGLAPLAGAGAWDNVGLLLRGTRSVSKIGLCIDLTAVVLDELEAADVDLVVAYHPLIFKGLKRITGDSAIERSVLRLIRSGRHLYSPHTALDAATGGMAEWLAACLGEVVDVAPIEVSAGDPAVGAGRMGRLAVPQSVAQLLPALRTTLGIENLRVAGDIDRPRVTFAVCPGSGGSLFASLGPTDLLVTGELGHHDVLARVAQGGAVVLTDHTNCERGYLPLFARRLAEALPGVQIVRSRLDADPLRVV